MTDTASATAAADELVSAILLTPEGRADPYPLYRRLREVAPAHRSALGPVWWFTRYDDCREALRHPHLGKAPEGAAAFTREDPRLQERGRHSLLRLNPPDHTRLRGLVSRAFTPKRVEALRPTVAAMVAEVLDRMADEGEVDVMDVLAFPLPVRVIGELVGVPAADRDAFRPLVRAATASLEPVIDEAAADAAVAASDEMRGYFADLVTERRRRPADDLATALVQARDGEDRLSEDELLATLILLFAAGFETTTNLVGNGLNALLRNPDQLDVLRREPDRTADAVEEVLRYDAPVQLDARYVHEPADIGGASLEPGDFVMTVLGAANRDPARYPEPDRFDITRTDSQVLSFAWGIHHCLGAPLARLEGQEVFRPLVERFPDMALLEDEPRYRGSLTLRGLERLRVRVR